MSHKSRIIGLVIFCMAVAATVLAIVFVVRQPIPANEIVLTPKMFGDDGKLLSIEDGELKDFREVFSSETASVGLLSLLQLRNSGGLLTGLTESEYTYMATLGVTYMDVEYAPQKPDGRPDHDYWADENCDGWPMIQRRKTSFYNWSVDLARLDYPILFKTFDGTKGVLKVTKVTEDDAHLRYRIIESAVGATSPRTPNVNARYIEKLPNGIGVELIGINSNPSGENTWWKPDGHEFKRGPYFNVRYRHPCSRGQEVYEVAWRFLYGKDASVFGRPVIRVPASLAHKEFTTLDEFKHSAFFDVRGDVFVFKVDTGRATLEFGIPAGQLQTVVVPEKGPRTAKVGAFTIEISLPEQGGEKMTVHTIVPKALIDDHLMRLILVDHMGNDHYLRNPVGLVAGAEPAAQERTWRLWPVDWHLQLSDIRGFRIEICRYQWIRFKNVSLKPGKDPGFETEVQDL